CHCPSLSSLHWEQLSCHGPPHPENVYLHQVHLHPLPVAASKPVPFQGTLTPQQSSLRLGADTVRVVGSGAEVRLCTGASSLGMPPFSEAAALLLCHFGLCLLGDYEGLLPAGDLSHLVCHVKEPSPSPIVLSSMSLLS
ncbi:hypothetical protein HPG69_000538, partial [Diceros bicornis minor]